MFLCAYVGVWGSLTSMSSQWNRTVKAVEGFIPFLDRQVYRLLIQSLCDLFDLVFDVFVAVQAGPLLHASAVEAMPALAKNEVAGEVAGTAVHAADRVALTVWRRDNSTLPHLDLLPAHRKAGDAERTEDVGVDGRLRGL